VPTSNAIYLLTIAFYESVLSELPCYSTNRGNGLSARVIYTKRSSKELFKNNTNSDAAWVCVFKGYSWRIFFPRQSKAMKGRDRVAHFSLAALKNSLKDKQKLSVNPEAYVRSSDP